MGNRPIEVLWKWNSYTGDPKYIVLVSEGKILARYGSERAIRKLRLDQQQQPEEPVELTSVRIAEEQSEIEDSEIVSREEYPLDNRAGAGKLEVEYEITKTVNNELRVQSLSEIGAAAGLSLNR